MGKPHTLEDPAKLELLENLARIQCTQREIAAVFGVDDATVERWYADPKFREIADRGKNEGLVSLRRAQFQAALKGNITMQIWLGKQLLNQRDNHAIEHTGPNGSQLLQLGQIDKMLAEALDKTTSD